MPPVKSASPARPLWALLTLAAVGALTLSGCTGGGGADPAPGPDDSSPTATPAPTLPADVTPAAVPTKVANDPDDRRNVVLSGCAATKGGWGAKGTATNPTKEDVTYDITVFFTTTSATTIDSARSRVEVKAGDTVDWSAAKKFSAPDEMLCVLRGVAAT